MASRPIWKGSISFGLVNVGVKAFTRGARPRGPLPPARQEVGRADPQPEGLGEERAADQADDIEMGYEVRKGKYVTFDRGRDRRAAARRRPARIDVTDFVALDDDRPDLLRAHLLARPRRRGRGSAYRLLLAAMEDEQRVGIGTVVMRNKQYLAAIRPLDGALAMSTHAVRRRGGARSPRSTASRARRRPTRRS